MHLFILLVRICEFKICGDYITEWPTFFPPTLSWMICINHCYIFCKLQLSFNIKSTWIFRGNNPINLIIFNQLFFEFELWDKILFGFFFFLQTKHCNICMLSKSTSKPSFITNKNPSKLKLSCVVSKKYLELVWLQAMIFQFPTNYKVSNAYSPCSNCL
jgi:hypothetical protein